MMNTVRRRMLLPLVAVLGLLLWTGVTTAQATTEPVAVAAYPPTKVVDYPPDCPDKNEYWSPSGGAMVCFNPDGEHLFVCDTKADSAHAMALWKGTHDDHPTALHNYEGNGTCVDGNFDMPENTYLDYKSCVVDDDINHSSCTVDYKRIGAHN